jgi:hypothetical protein
MEAVPSAPTQRRFNDISLALGDEIGMHSICGS